MVLSLLVLLLVALPVEAYVQVKGYYRSDGTYVRPHVRSNPNGLKYDNYGYKPSQGLYNPSYGTRGAAWDTPTYITDPDYYAGKSLYESRSSRSFDSSYRYTPSSRSGSTYTSSYTASDPSYYPSSYGSSYYSDLLKSLDEPETKQKKWTKSISWMVKNWSESHPMTSCREAPLTGKDKKLCQLYRDKQDDDGYLWSVSKTVDKKYTSCDGGDTYYYGPAACGKGKQVVCQGTTAMCQVK